MRICGRQTVIVILPLFVRIRGIFLRTVHVPLINEHEIEFEITFPGYTRVPSKLRKVKKVCEGFFLLFFCHSSYFENE